MLKRFKIGGIHPNDNKLSKSAAIELFPLPNEVVILLAQHIGAPAVAVVKKGDLVNVGDLIGKSAGFISANIHSSVSGVVKSVDSVKDSSGILRPAVTITVADDQVWADGIDLSDSLVTDCQLSPQEIVKKVEAAGIVGLGGATFPSSVKLQVPKDKKAVALVVNAVECEPYLTADHSLMLEHSDEILEGVKIVCRAIGVDKAYIGIENNKPDAIALLQQKCSTVSGLSIDVVALRLQYPQGSEKQLIEAVMGRAVPSGALPIEVGAVVQNVGTIVAIYEAVAKNKPLIERIVTVTGKSLQTPKNLKVRVGTPISALIEYCGGVPESVQKIINGGPMMGRAMSNVSAPVTKGTSGVLLMDSPEAKRAEQSPCIRCAKCVSVCPMGLEPYEINTLSRLSKWDNILDYAAYDCIECGSCSYTCPAKLPLLDNIRIAKAESLRILRSKK